MTKANLSVNLNQNHTAMKYVVMTLFVMLGFGIQAQSLVGSWQLTEEKTCFESQIAESDTEKELRKNMGSTMNAVARIIKFDKKGNGEEGVFAVGVKKGSGMRAFAYKVNGDELLLLDKKSGMMTQQLIVDELTSAKLKFHVASKDCETKTFSRIK